MRSHRPVAIAVLALVPAAIFACSLVADLDALQELPCGTEGVCRAGVPSGWEGPAILVDGPDDAGCDGAFTLRALGTLNTAVNAGPAGCACTCGPAAGACTWRVDSLASTTCGGTPTFSDLGFTNDCSPTSGMAGVGSLRILDAGTASGDAACVPRVVTTKPAIATTPQHLCVGSFFVDTCPSGSLCLPQSAPAACIARAGDNACPLPYAKKTILPRTLDDRRSCGACTCEVDASPCSAPPATRVGPGACTATDDSGIFTPTITINSTQCLRIETKSGDEALVVATGTCPVKNQPTPTGSVVGADMVTICCLP